jgi:hypothetical protein
MQISDARLASRWKVWQRLDVGWRKVVMTGRTRIFRLLGFFVALLCAGCGAAGTGVSGGGTAAAPSITQQPADQSIPMGLTAGFSVVASGTNLSYQWSRNGTPISGATGSTYNTPSLDFSDTGATFTVAVSNTQGTVSSNPAKLTVTARAPRPGDLRFQQVDAASTLNGYSIIPPAIYGPYTTYLGGITPGGSGFGEATGTPLFLSNSGGLWQFTPFSLPTGVTGLDTGYLYGPSSDLQSVLSSPGLGQGSTVLNAPNSVITSISFSVLPTLLGTQSLPFALSYVQSNRSTGFDLMQQTVDPLAFQSAVTQEGLHSRVVTAASFNGSQITYMSYGWTSDPSTIYESKVTIATLDTATDAMVSLAQQGYIITATGSSLTSDGSKVLLVGTRVRGDTMARPFLVGSVFTGMIDDVFSKGYAVVGVVNEFSGDNLVVKNYVGER